VVYPPYEFPAESDPACIAADGVIVILERVRDYSTLSLGGGAVFIELLVAIAGILALAGVTVFSGGVALPAILVFVGAILAIGAVGLSSAWDDTFMQTLRCKLYAHVGEDGIWDETEYSNLVADLGDLSEPGGSLVGNLLSLMGAAQLNNAAYFGRDNADCSECDQPGEFPGEVLRGEAITSGADAWVISSAEDVSGEYGPSGHYVIFSLDAGMRVDLAYAGMPDDHYFSCLPVESFPKNNGSPESGEYTLRVHGCYRDAPFEVSLTLLYEDYCPDN
jgi:hypothetical protein